MDYKRDTKGMSRRRKEQELKHSLRNMSKHLRPIHWLFIGIGILCFITLIYFGTDVLSNPDVDALSTSVITQRHTKHQVVAEIDAEKEIEAAKDSAAESPTTKPGVISTDIKGDWSSDAVSGIKVAWLYLSNIYESQGTLSVVQGHYSCSCTPETADVPQSYSRSSVAFGPFQADSIYAASGYFQGLVNQGYTEMSQFVGLSNDQYKSYDVRKAAHKAMLTRESESKVSFLTASAVAMQKQYLPEAQLAKLEETLGKSRADIPDAVIGGIFSCNIYTGANFGNTYIRKINSSMSDTELIEILYETRRSIKNGDYPRVDNEKQLALQMLDANFNGYEPHDIPGKGNVSWGHNMGVPNY